MADPLFSLQRIKAALGGDAYKWFISFFIRGRFDANDNLISLVNPRTGLDIALPGGGSNIAPTGPNARQIRYDQDGNPIVLLTDITGNGIEYNNTAMLIPMDIIAGYLGMDIFERLVLGESWAVPVYDFGDRLIVGNNIFMRIADPNNPGGGHIYVMTKSMKVGLTGLSLVGLNNLSTARKDAGKFIPISNTYRWAGDRVVTITVTANNPLKDVLISLGHSAIRSQTKYWVEWLIPSTNTTNTFTCQVRVFVEGDGTLLRFEQVSAATAPTKYPASRKLDANVMSGLEMPVFVKFNSSAAPLVVITNIEAVVELAEPKKEPFLTTVKTKEASKLPFRHTDKLCNMALGKEALARRAINTFNWASTGNNTTGTINAIGNAGEEWITVYRTDLVKPGSYPSIAWLYGAADSDFEGHNNFGKKTADIFGAGSKVVEVNHVGKQLKMSRPLLQNLSLRGREGWGAINGLQFFPVSQTLAARLGTYANDDTQISQFTGILNTNSARAVEGVVTLPIVYLSQKDPIRQWTCGSLVAWNGWPFGKPNATNNTFGENFRDFSFFMRTPDSLTTAVIENPSNPDRNLVLIPPDGSVLVDSYQTRFNATTKVYSSDRMMGLDPYMDACSYILDRPELLTTGRSNTTRAIGVGGLGSGILRDWEWRLFPDSNRTDESEEEIDLAIELSMSIIQHGFTMTMDISQSKSRRYCPDASNQSDKRTYYAYISQFDQHKPNIADPGIGYKLWEVTYIEGGDFVDAMTFTVSKIGPGGTVLDGFVSYTGQYRTIPTGTTYSTNASGNGVGLQLSVTGLPDASIISAATAFPIWSIASTMQYPAENIDSNAPTEYSSTVPPGQKFQLAPGADLAKIWKQKRLTDPLNPQWSYFVLGIYAAGQNFGFTHNDVAYQTHWLIVIEASLRDTPAWAILNTEAFKRGVKQKLVAVENINKFNNGGTPRVESPVLRSATNPIATLTSANTLSVD